MCSTAHTWRLAATIGGLIAAAVVIAVLVLQSGGSTSRTFAHESPAECNANALSLAMARTPATTVQGGTIEYRILARNNIAGDPFACDITGANVSFTEPAADGTATGTTHTL